MNCYFSQNDPLLFEYDDAVKKKLFSGDLTVQFVDIVEISSNKYSAKHSVVVKMKETCKKYYSTTTNQSGTVRKDSSVLGSQPSAPPKHVNQTFLDHEKNSEEQLSSTSSSKN